MVEALVDTSILIDVIRGHPPALEWIKKVDQLGVTPPSYMEFVGGSRDNREQRRALKLLSRFELIFLTEADFTWAIKQQSLYGLSYGIGMIDFLIAAVHPRLKVPLYTRNLKHFRPLIGSLAQAPY